MFPARLFGTVILILLLNWSSLGSTASIGTLVPLIRADGVLVAPEDNKYYLRIENQDGTVREETVEEVSPGQLQVKGSFREVYPGFKSLKVTYEAGANGYVAKYSFGEDSAVILQLPASVLKSAAG